MKVLKYFVLLGALILPVLNGCSAPPTGAQGDENDVEENVDDVGEEEEAANAEVEE